MFCNWASIFLDTVIEYHILGDKDGGSYQNVKFFTRSIGQIVENGLSIYTFLDCIKAYSKFIRSHKWYFLGTCGWQ